MDKFEASNGMKIPVDGHPFALINATGKTTQTFSTEEAQALREFFRAERDEELGRWRWPENPNVVVYAVSDRAARAVDEATGETWEQTRELVRLRDALSGGLGHMHNALVAYFESHPERKPWHDAKEGEVWVLTLDGDEIPYMARPSIGNNVYFEGVIDGIKPDSTMITAGRRIYPEEP